MSTLVDLVQDLYRAKSYRFFTQGAYNLNLFGVRRAQDGVNLFNDVLGCVYRPAADAPLKLERWPGTTDPGSYYLRQPMNSGGTAIVVPGQYPGLWELATHKGQPAFRQVGDVTVYRDGDRDNELDMDPGTKRTGVFAINGHRAGAASKLVDRWSAGCQVWSRAADLERALELGRAQLKAHPTWKATFTYTLFDAADQPAALALFEGL